ncbi:hypothetical protein OJF2_40280 [Aquisphaera giovannonii]|uniref:PEP-CTERM protein-sorting domain-containing protein n=1 Tax=Aquisphaera giovannonii TaxID=406548 RepID=A0A5B9W4D0_9BACT|nr:hypothetical protein [Aquisphaera giovannonii]QEH35476.1 hypothetical protein OJF2_40280 [Aquisphaera giovannonii]
MKIRTRSSLIALAISALGLGLRPAPADTIPYTSALSYAYNTDDDTPQSVTHSDPATASSVTLGQGGDYGSVGGFASADLSTGQLKVRATDAAQTGYNPYVQTNASFGDGFRTFGPGGSPFSWSPDTGARFTLDLTGSKVSSSGSLADLGYGQAGAYILLSIFKPGTLGPDSSVVGDPNNVAYFLYLLGNPNQQLGYVDPSHNLHLLSPTAYYGDLTQDIHITQDFQPGGDFDWVVLMGAGGGLNGGQSYDMDLSHTLTVGYSGPAGTTTESVSGIFHNFGAAVPEPAGVAMLAIGLGGALAARYLAGRRAPGSSGEAG